MHTRFSEVVLHLGITQGCCVGSESTEGFLVARDRLRQVLPGIRPRQPGVGEAQIVPQRRPEERIFLLADPVSQSLYPCYLAMMNTRVCLRLTWPMQQFIDLGPKVGRDLDLPSEWLCLE
jgi:hypothetical protein